ncbi:hypothetical protein [Natrinema salsiterrestre]|uniref:DUF8108 domain-containing protein n=1 Tax=Natrinema salsiterrestre TaxID=2950540 RepID=A0A9Q4Q055_9EURY|nr:hypothetical protein [Natrinema salsiterrestre]MDF9745379.1 hypothetical protein [Natrinema salsiterrestre]
MTRPDDVLFRSRVETFAVIRKLVPIALLVAALVGPILVVDPAIGMWLSALSFLLALVGLHLVSRLPLYPAHAFGIEYRFEDERFEADRRRCVRCDAQTDSGTHRRYARQIVILGVPLHTLEWGENDFCDDCIGLEDGVGSSPNAERSAESNPRSNGSTTVEPDQHRDHDRKRHSNEETESSATVTTRVDDEIPRLERAQRIDRSSEETALELRRAFE